jgi:hypothetical protein
VAINRKSNFFEKILLVVGLGVILLGFHFINSVYSNGLTEMWGLVQSVFLWLMLIILVVLLATEEDVKEELSIIMRQQIDEVRLIQEEIRLMKEQSTNLNKVNDEQLEELRRLRKELESHKYKL